MALYAGFTLNVNRAKWLYCDRKIGRVWTYTFLSMPAEIQEDCQRSRDVSLIVKGQLQGVAIAADYSTEYFRD